MTCYSGFGNLSDGKHPIWTGDFNGDGRSEILFYFAGDGNWWLGTFIGNTISWALAGNSSDFENLADGRPIWVGDFTGSGKTDILFYFPANQNWWLGQFGNDNRISWNLAGNTSGFGQVWDRRPFWIGNFSGSGKADILFYYPSDGNWWRGHFDGTQLNWSLAGNTAGFGNLADGRPIWVADFTGAGKADVLFYYPGDRNWWLGQFGEDHKLSWSLAGNTSGFGQVWDRRPFFLGDFGGDNKADLLFYFPGDHNWWRGTFNGNQLNWALAGNTAGFGNLADGRPIWTGDFAGTGRSEVLFYFPGDRNWWLGQFGNDDKLSWNLAGNTAGFGQVWDGRPFWLGNFSGDSKAEILFYFPGDGNWWQGKFSGNQLQWSFAGNTGRPCRESVVVHFKSLVTLNDNINRFINDQFLAIHELYAEGGVAVYRGTTEDLSGNVALQSLRNLNVGNCIMGQPTQDQNTLFANRNNAGTNDLVIYIVSTLIGRTGNFLGCATHPAGQPGAAVVQAGAQWLLAHEVGHVLGLRHVCEFATATNPTPPTPCTAGSTQSDNLMFPNVGWSNVPPDLSAAEYTTMFNSGFTRPC